MLSLGWETIQWLSALLSLSSLPLLGTVFNLRTLINLDFLKVFVLKNLSAVRAQKCMKPSGEGASETDWCKNLVLRRGREKGGRGAILLVALNRNKLKNKTRKLSGSWEVECKLCQDLKIYKLMLVLHVFLMIEESICFVHGAPSTEKVQVNNLF